MDILHDAVARQRTDAGTASESPVSAVSWPAIVGGAVVAAATALTLSALGLGVGLVAVSPWPYHGISPKTFTIATAIWLVVVQWLSSAAGGYLTGRLRTKWVGTHTHEVFFRDTAHGFITWAVSTLIGAILLGSAASSLAGSGVDAAAMAGSSVTQPGEGAAGSAAIYTALSMMVGAFIACVAAALGGLQRDQHP
jgi:hypothetical protein